MNIIEINDIEDCFDGTFIKEAVFDEIIHEDFVLSLKNFGNLDYFPQFSRPFFKLEVKGDYTCKGVIGNRTVRIILKRSNVEQSLDNFMELVKKVNLKLNN